LDREGRFLVLRQGNGLFVAYFGILIEQTLNCVFMFYGVALITGIVLLLMSVFSIKERLDFLKKSEKVTGTVIDVEETDNEGITYKPIFQYTTGNHQTYTYRHFGSSSNPLRWNIGDEAIITYDPYNPSNGMLLTYWGVFNYSVILMAIAVALIVIGGGYYLAGLVLR
jgi:hypothetical protein